MQSAVKLKWHCTVEREREKEMVIIAGNEEEDEEDECGNNGKQLQTGTHTQTHYLLVVVVVYGGQWPGSNCGRELSPSSSDSPFSHAGSAKTQ